MKLGPMTVFMFVMYLFIGIFDQTFDKNLNVLDAYGNAGQNFLFATILQPWNWGGTIDLPLVGAVPMFLMILGSAISVAVGIAVFGSILGRSDISTLFALFVAFTTLGALPCIVLYNFVARNVGMFVTDCVVGQPCGPAMIAGALTAGILAIMWLFTCVEWWAWRSAT
jgi:hypothetical protein